MHLRRRPRVVARRLRRPPHRRVLRRHLHRLPRRRVAVRACTPRFPAPASPFAQAPAGSCAVCRGAVGGGSAAVTSECRHTFHLHCLVGPVSTCPLCQARWSHSITACSTLSLPPFQAMPNPFSSSPVYPAAPGVYDYDEPVEPPAQVAAPPDLDGWNVVQGGGAALVLETHCELPAVASGKAHDPLAVLLHAKAPSAAAAASEAAAPAPSSLDLVTVLDVSGSMTGAKLALLKRAMEFVVDKLGPADRLSVVSFSSQAARVIRLTRMSDAGKAAAKSAVQSLYVGYGGDYHDLVPRTLAGDAGSRSTPIHTFGFGTDHDSAAMHTIAEATGGTFSFIENQAVVQDSFAQCGLLSVAVQEAWISVACLHPGVRVREVKSGRYRSRVDAYGRAASVDVGELYADEERRFLLLVDVPAGEDTTRLVKATTATGQAVEVAAEDAAVRR